MRMTLDASAKATQEEITAVYTLVPAGMLFFVVLPLRVHLETTLLENYICKASFSERRRGEMNDEFYPHHRSLPADDAVRVRESVIFSPGRERGTLKPLHCDSRTENATQMLRCGREKSIIIVAADRSRRRSSGTPPAFRLGYFSSSRSCARRASSCFLFVERERGMVTRCVPCFVSADARGPGSACCEFWRQPIDIYSKYPEGTSLPRCYAYHVQRYRCTSDYCRTLWRNDNPALSFPRRIQPD